MSKIIVLFFCSFSLFANYSDKERGLVWGSLYGDSFGGPYEFQNVSKHALTKKKRQLTKSEWEELESSVELVDYKIKASSYGPWINNAPKGTITDDSRHKIIFWNCYEKNKNFSKAILANCYIEYYKKNASYKKWLKEVVHSSYFIIDPKHKLALPLERLWGGIPTMAGQMIFTPMALIYPNDPKQSYTKSFSLNYIDNGTAKDYTSSLIGALSYALKEEATWEGVKKTIVNNDPFLYSQVPYVNREVVESLELSMKIVREAKGIIPNLYSLLESHLNARTWWEADVTFIISMTVMEFSKKHPMAAFAIIRDFGHDTDSYCQLIGSFYGALYGESFFPSNEVDMIKEHISKYYDKSLKSFF